KDRFGAQIRTHYPPDVATEVAIVAQEATPLDALYEPGAPGERPTRPVGGVSVSLPPFMADLVARLSQAARASNRVNQRSGVSVRLSVANQETLLAASLRRALRLGESDAAPRVSDLGALAASTLGKVEVEGFEEGEDQEVFRELVDQAVRQTFRESVAPQGLPEVVAAFGEGLVVEVGPAAGSREYLELVAGLAPLKKVVAGLVGPEAPASSVASAVELVLEGLHLSRRLNKDGGGDPGVPASYRSR
ncbi:MAG: hypothetical protein JWM85_3590, partial [Acidimicrobiaceae bacterium]|nr:hypothetical protein [Acidimicrobiaceae bacterium]